MDIHFIYSLSLDYFNIYFYHGFPYIYIGVLAIGAAMMTGAIWQENRCELNWSELYLVKTFLLFSFTISIGDETLRQSFHFGDNHPECYKMCYSVASYCDAHH